VIAKYKKREEWEVLKDVRRLVESIEDKLERMEPV